jgi:RNA polymerase sigma factor (TIGR02999 family)
MDSAEPQLTELLQRFAEGDRNLAEVILQEILPNLHRIASGQISRERSHLPLTPTELIHEVWISSLHKGRWSIQNRAQFFAIAAHAMRCVLVDLARRRLAQFRGNGMQPMPLEDLLTEPQSPVSATPDTILEIDRLMNRLEQVNPTVARIVEMQYFCGFTIEEIAKETGLSSSQVRQLWLKGKKWLATKLKRP